MTTYSLRKGAADKTKTDLVVAGVVKTKKGLEMAPGGEGVASAYGRKLEPLLSTLGFAGKPGEVVKIPTSGALKTPLLILVGLGDAEARDRLAREVATLQRVRSPHIAEMLDAEPYSETPFVVTRYVPGLSLHAHVAAEGTVEGPDLYWLAGCLGEGLAGRHHIDHRLDPARRDAG